jgi:hypothetical protein
MGDAKLINRLLEVIEQDIIPLTREAVPKGNKKNKDKVDMPLK